MQDDLDGRLSGICAVLREAIVLFDEGKTHGSAGLLGQAFQQAEATRDACRRQSAFVGALCEEVGADRALAIHALVKPRIFK